jgi:CBS domain-containing protein
MPTVADLLKQKGSQVFTIDAESTVLEAAQQMNQRRVGSLVVTRSGRVAGIFTERDILTRIVAGQRDPRTTRVRDAMTSDPIVASPSTNLDQLRAVMREKRIRHIPVIHDEELCGMVSIGDLNQIEVRVLAETIQYMEQYTIRS